MRRTVSAASKRAATRRRPLQHLAVALRHGDVELELAPLGQLLDCCIEIAAGNAEIRRTPRGLEFGLSNRLCHVMEDGCRGQRFARVEELLLAIDTAAELEIIPFAA